MIFIQETGYGISTRICDNDGYPIIEVNCRDQTVGFRMEDADSPFKTFSFLDFISIKAFEWPEDGDEA